MKQLFFYGHQGTMLIAIVSALFCPILIAYTAIITVPIADLIGSPLPTYHQSSKQAYDELPLCGATHQPFVACPRFHQALFNQEVDVIQEQGDQVYITVPNIFYCTNHNSVLHNKFWTARCNITPLNMLKQEGINLSTFPRPITASTKTVPENNIITLIQPFHDTTTGLTFSAGTRFSCIDTTHKHTIPVYRYDRARKKTSIMHIPKKLCRINSAEHTPHERVQQYVALARQWAQQTDGVIPYVWGGCSYIERSQPNNFTEIIKHNEQPYSYYIRPDCSQNPKSGVDCSGFICLAAQCCGIPYFLKNSIAVSRYLRPIAAGETIIEGDIIWISKHVMIVGSLKKNTLIEARHYTSGYGRVHEIALSAVFKDITTYKELHDACVNKKPLIRLDSNGKDQEVIDECKLLHIMSVWPYFASSLEA